MSAGFTSYRALSFDVFGTLLDWEAGFYPYLRPIVDQLPSDHPCATPFPTQPPADSPNSLASKHPIFIAFSRHENKIQAELPKLRHETVLAYAYRDLATELNVKADPDDVQRASHSYGTWPSFPDTVKAMQALAKHYKLIALSNVSNEGIQQVLEGPFKDIKFDAVYTAEAIGSYKPALDNYEYLIDGVKREFGVEQEQLLHVAHGIHDQVAPEHIGLDHVWVERGVDNGSDQLEGMKRLRIVRDMKQLEDEVERAYAKE